MSNPLLEKFDQPFGTIPFNKITTDDFVPALDEAIEEAKSEIDAIAGNPENPTFENTILAQELSGKKLGRVAVGFFASLPDLLPGLKSVLDELVIRS